MEILILFILAMMIWFISYAIAIWIPKLLNKTILKKHHYNKILERVKYDLEYNKEMIKLYKGEIKERSEQYENDSGTCYCFEFCQDYYRNAGIDEELIQEGIRSEKEAIRLSKPYFEKMRKEDIESRIKFIEKELKDIKRRM